MTERSGRNAIPHKWPLAALGSLVAIAGGAALIPAIGQPKNCITDSELEAAVGDQLRSGAFAIKTSHLRDAPMCSGLTVAQAIQKLGERISPTARPTPQAARPTPVSVPQGGGGQPSLPSSTSAELFAYAGKDHWTKVKARTFFEHPAVVSGLKNAGVTPAVRREISTYEVSTAITRQGDVLLDMGCFPRACDTNHYRVFVNAVSGNAAVCLFDGGPDAKWYFGGGSTPLVVRGRDCNVDTLGQAPSEVSRALATGAVGPGARPAAATGGGAGAGPDLGKLLVFTSPARCEIGETFATFISDLVVYPESNSSDIPHLGKVTVPSAYRSVVGAPKQTRFKDGLNIRVPIRGQWNGIPVVALEGLYWNGGDSAGYSVVMKGAFEDVRVKLNRAGFNIPQSGNRTIPGDYETEMSLERKGSEVTFTCI